MMSSAPIPLSPVKFCSGGGGALELIGRPSLMLPPSLVEEGGTSKLEYNFYSPLKKFNRDKGDTTFYSHPLNKKQDLVRFDNRSKQDLVRFDNRGDEEVVSLMQDKDTNWVGSSHGWLGLFNKNNRSMSLINPVSGRTIHLPPIHGHNDNVNYPIKVILSHSPTDEKCRAIAIRGKPYDRAAVCSPGRCEWWSPLGLPWDEPYRYIDFVYCRSRKTFVSANAVSSWWAPDTYELEFWDPSSKMKAPVKALRLPPVSWSDTGRWWRTYLVSEEESGQLFVVRRWYQVDTTRVGYDVYGVDDYFGRDIVQLRGSLDDLVMFIGMNHCFAVRASRFPEYRPNCIYFSGIWFDRNQCADIYDYNNKDYSPLFYLSPNHDWPFDNMLPWFTLTKD